MEGWSCWDNWKLDALEKKYRHASFKVGEDDNGKKLKLRLKYFLDYMRVQVDDSPIYLFESALEDSAKMCDILKDWNVPYIFPYDLHSVLGQEERPPNRWFLIGPKRSGTTMHLDPINTAAWNALHTGIKRWALMDPGLEPAIVKGKTVRKSGEDNEAIDWFTLHLPRMKEKYPHLKIYECLQKPGDVIFVPQKWWHCVINLEDTIACTQNFVSPANFDRAWRSMRVSRPKLSKRWLKRLERFYPEFADRAMELSSHDDQFGAVEEASSTSDSSSSSDPSTSESEDYEEVRSYLTWLRDRLPEDVQNLVEQKIRFMPLKTKAAAVVMHSELFSEDLNSSSESSSEVKGKGVEMMEKAKKNRKPFVLQLHENLSEEGGESNMDKEITIQTDLQSNQIPKKEKKKKGEQCYDLKMEICKENQFKEGKVDVEGPKKRKRHTDKVEDEIKKQKKKKNV